MVIRVAFILFFEKEKSHNLDFASRVDLINGQKAEKQLNPGIDSIDRDTEQK